MNDNKEIANKLMDTIRRFKKIGFLTKCTHDLTPGQIGMLHLIYHQGNNEIKGISVRHISELSQQTPSGVTQAINFLVNKELVTRTIDEYDRRIMRVKLTPLGLKQVKEHHQNLLNLSYGFIENLGQEKILTFIDILEEMIAYGERIQK